MNEENQINQTPVTIVPAKDSTNDWSWGAFILDPFYLIAIKKYDYLWMYLLYLIPVINFFTMIGIKIFLGLKGHRLVTESVMFKNEDERRGFIRATDHAGFIIAIIALAGIALIFLFGGVSTMMFGGGWGGGSMMRYY